jgi:hypothetical protein
LLQARPLASIDTGGVLVARHRRHRRRVIRTAAQGLPVVGLAGGRRDPGEVAGVIGEGKTGQAQAQGSNRNQLFHDGLHVVWNFTSTTIVLAEGDPDMEKIISCDLKIIQISRNLHGRAGLRAWSIVVQRPPAAVRRLAMAW